MIAPPPLIVLVETMGPANIGSVARSVAAYGLSTFRLVAPRCEMDDSTLMWATYGKRVLPQVEVFSELSAALHDVDYAVALSRREGKNRHRHYTLPAVSQEVLPELEAGGKQIAFVFGNEESGLATSHLTACHCTVEIPTLAPDGSLNLAHSVTVTLYEWLGRRQASATLPEPKNRHEQPASAERLRGLLARTSSLLASVGYPRHRSTLEKELVKLESIVMRCELQDWEARLLMGMLKQTSYRLENPR